MIRNFNEAGMDSLFPKWSEGRPATFTPKARARICRIACQRPEKFGLPFTFDELGPLNLVPTPVCAGPSARDRSAFRPTTTSSRAYGSFFACYHVGEDQLWGRMEKRKGRRPTLRALKSIRERVPKRKRIYVILDNLNHHKGKDLRQWADENNVELLFTPTYASWANPIVCHLGAIRHGQALAGGPGTDRRPFGKPLTAYSLGCKGGGFTERDVDFSLEFR